MEKVFKVAQIKDLLNQVHNEEITFSRFVEILNEQFECKGNPANLKGLEQIEFTLRNFSAISFAETKLQAEKDAPERDYYTYMRNCYSGKDNPTIEECEQNAFIQFINEYKKCCEVYAGWVKNGRVFILDKRDKLVLFLYKKDETTHSAVVHYNPLGVDLLEQSCSNIQFLKDLESGRYDISINEDLIIKECAELAGI